MAVLERWQCHWCLIVRPGRSCMRHQFKCNQHLIKLAVSKIWLTNKWTIMREMSVDQRYKIIMEAIILWLKIQMYRPTHTIKINNSVELANMQMILGLEIHRIRLRHRVGRWVIWISLEVWLRPCHQKTRRISAVPATSIFLMVRQLLVYQWKIMEAIIRTIWILIAITIMRERTLV